MRDECEGNATLDGRCWTRARAESAVLGFSVRHMKKKNKLGMVYAHASSTGVASRPWRANGSHEQKLFDVFPTFLHLRQFGSLAFLQFGAVWPANFL